MKFKNSSRKIKKECHSQLAFEFEESNVIEVNIKTPKNTLINFPNYVTHKQRFTIKLCEN